MPLQSPSYLRGGDAGILAFSLQSTVNTKRDQMMELVVFREGNTAQQGTEETWAGPRINAPTPLCDLKALTQQPWAKGFL